MKTRRLTKEETAEIMRVKNPKTKGEKLRLLAVMTQVFVLPLIGKENGESDIIADLMQWADEADFVDHALTCKDCINGAVESGIEYGEAKFA